MNRKQLVLAALFGILVVCLVYAYLATPTLEKAPPRAASQKARSTKSLKVAAKADNGARIDFAFLETEQKKFPGAKRDIFRFGAKKRTEKKKKVAPVVEKPAPAPVAEPVTVPEVTPIKVVQRSLSQFTFLGFLDKGGEKTVFLSTRGDLFLVKSGENFGIDNEFYVDAIDGNLLKVKHAGMDRLIEVTLIEQKKLSAAVSAPVSMPASPAPSPMRNKVFKPQRKVGLPVAPPENEEPFREIIEEYNPEEQEQVPLEGDKAEGEPDGANQ